MNGYLVNRNIAAGRPSELRRAQTGRAFRSLQRSSTKTLKKRHFAAVNALDIEQINGR